MSWFRLLWRSLVFHWRTNIAVLLGSAVGAAALGGALLVGESVRESLRLLTLERLGQIDDALVANRFFPQDLGERLRRHPDFTLHYGATAPAIVIQGSVASPSGTLATGVTIVGTTRAFWDLYPDRAGEAEALAGLVIANEPLATELQSAAGARIIVRTEKRSAIPKETLLGERDAVTQTATFTVDRVIPALGAGRFSLTANQRRPKLLFLPLEPLGRALDQSGRINALFLTTVQKESAEGASRPDADDTIRVAAANRILRDVARLDDFALRLRPDQKFGYVAVESDRQVIEPVLADAVVDTARETGTAAAGVLTYLANTIAIGAKQVPYSIVTALESGGPELAGLPVTPKDAQLGKDAILLNEWAAEQLQAKVGDAVRLEYYQVGDDGALTTAAHGFHLAGVVGMAGPALDRNFTPQFPGITDARTMGDWDPPFPIDLKRIRKVDEQYWDKYRTVPKAFVRLADVEDLWTTRFGRRTSIRLRPGPSGPAAPADVEKLATTFATELVRRTDPAALGLAFVPIKSRDLAASAGSTDFGQLFLAFSFFLIVAAALLVGLLFRLNAERRAPQVGLLLAVGFRERSIRWLLWGEGFALAALGSALGLYGAIGYARLMIAALTTRWQQAVGAPFISFHGSAAALALAWVVAVGVAMTAIVWSVWRIGRASVPRLLARGFGGGIEAVDRAGRVNRALALGGLAGGLAALLGAPWLGGALAFFMGGTLLLVGGLAGLSILVRRQNQNMVQGRGLAALARLGVRNGGRHPGRSVLTAALLAFATFVLVAIGALRHEGHDDEPKRDSGNGGFRLLATSDVPIILDLARPQDRFELNIADDTSGMLDRLEVHSLRVRQGDDASCLNVYRPQSPSILGVDERLLERGGFAFAGHIAADDAERANPWKLLQKRFDDGAIPALGDANTLRWILKTGVGKDLVMEGEAGRPITLRIVAALQGSIFQGELLISEQRFLEQFPHVAGRRFFLFQTPSGWTRSDVDSFTTRIERDLVDYGFDVITTAERLAAYRAVENTYMTAFLSIGGFGLLLGTLGLGVVLWRNVLERTSELGLLRALGFRRSALGWLVLAENCFLLVSGLVLGSACAHLAVAPQLVAGAHWAGLVPVWWILVGVFAVGLCSGVVAVVAAVRLPLLAALRRE